MKSDIISLELFDKKESNVTRSSASGFPYFNIGCDQYVSFFNLAKGRINLINRDIDNFYCTIKFKQVPYHYCIEHNIYNSVILCKTYFECCICEIKMKEKFSNIEKEITVNNGILSTLHTFWYGGQTDIESFFIQINRGIDEIIEKQNKIYSEYFGTIGSYDI